MKDEMAQGPKELIINIYSIINNNRQTVPQTLKQKTITVKFMEFSKFVILSNAKSSPK